MWTAGRRKANAMQALGPRGKYVECRCRNHPQNDISKGLMHMATYRVLRCLSDAVFWEIGDEQFDFLIQARRFFTNRRHMQSLPHEDLLIVRDMDYTPKDAKS
jgi:hypothetical protein